NFRNRGVGGGAGGRREGGVPGGAVQPRPQTLRAPSSPAATAGRRGDAFDPAQNPNAPGAPHTLGAINPPGGAPIVGADAGEPPVGAPGGRGAAAPLDLATMGPQSGPQPAQSPHNPAAGRARHAGALADPERRIRSRLRLCAAQGLRARRRRLPQLLEQISQRSARRRRPLLARPKHVPGPALPRPGGTLPPPLDPKPSAPPSTPCA